MTTRIAMWSGPRNLSTALLRSWENRPDTTVLDEPLYAHYLAETGLEHPGRHEILANGPVGGAEAIERCLAPLPEGIDVSYQKHMTHHLLPGLDRAWLDELRNLLLIRHPVEVLASYSRIRDEVTLDDIGLPQQIELADRAELTIDAGDFGRDPARYLRFVCSHLEVRFVDEMLHWPPGRRDSDGCWAPYWYTAVEASTSFQPPRPPLDVKAALDALPTGLRGLAFEAIPLYEELAARRLRL